MTPIMMPRSLCTADERLSKKLLMLGSVEQKFSFSFWGMEKTERSNR
jgi:hypothetical protein